MVRKVFMHPERRDGGRAGRDDEATGAPEAGARRWPILGMLGWVAAPVLGAEMSSRGISPPFYAGVVVALVSLMVFSSARTLLAPVLRRRASDAPASRQRLPVGSLYRLTYLVAGSGESDAVAASFARALGAFLGIEPGAVLVRREEPAREGEALGGRSPADRSGPVEEVVADAAASYAEGADWLPLVVDNAEVGRVILADGRGRRPLGEADAALAAVLCSLFALYLRNEQYREEIDCREAEMEALRRRLETECTAVRTPVRRMEGFPDLIGQSEALRRVLALVERTAPSDVSILVTGETGTGKELVVRAVHEVSRRRDGALVTVNCPAILGPLAESELFGHERGAFTDAVAARPGQFELAHGGTIFLDEVADLPLEIQAKLLRVLQEREVRRVGGHRAQPVDVRTVAATNRDLATLVREGRFREDLYYRLAAVEIAMPPLRARHGDIAILASFFLDQAAAAYGRKLSGFTPEALAALGRYTWPGNIRQLQNVVHRAALLCGGERIRPADLVGISAEGEGESPCFGDSIRQEKKRRFLEALHQTGWNQSAAARLLGMSRSNFARMVRSLGIQVPRRGERSGVSKGGGHQ